MAFTPIPGFDLYGVSKEGQVCNLKTGRILKTRPHPDGYLQHVLCATDKGPKTVSLHRLLALTFLPNLENKAQVNHKNGIKTDNRIENLEWVTISENRQHAYDTGLQKPHSVWRKIDGATAEYIRNQRGIKSQNTLARELSVSQSLIGLIQRGQRRLLKGA